MRAATCVHSHPLVNAEGASAASLETLVYNVSASAVKIESCDWMIEINHCIGWPPRSKRAKDTRVLEKHPFIQLVVSLTRHQCVMDV